MRAIAIAHVIRVISHEPKRKTLCEFGPPTAQAYQLEMDLSGDRPSPAYLKMVERLSELPEEAKWEAMILRESFDYAGALRAKGHIHHAELAEWQASKQARIWLDTWCPVI